jgi:head-tail adaptor
MSIGRKETLVVIEGATVVTNPDNEEIETWGSIGSEWAALFYGQGQERRAAAMEQGQVSANFQMWSNALTRSVNLRNRFNVDGALWDIVGIAPDTPVRGEIEFTAIRAVD